MVKREKRIERSIESLRKRIEEHFAQLERDIREGNDIVARYHVKEIDRSLIDALEKRMSLMGGGVDTKLIERYRQRLKRLEEGMDS